MLLQAPERRQQPRARGTRGALLRLQRELVSFVGHPVLHFLPAGFAQRLCQLLKNVNIELMTGLEDNGL